MGGKRLELETFLGTILRIQSYFKSYLMKIMYRVNTKTLLDL